MADAAEMSNLIQHFERVALPYLRLFDANTCIEQTRILAECLKHFGAEVEAVEVMLCVQCLELHVAYLSGVTDLEERRHYRERSASWVDRVAGGFESEGNGHVVALVRIDDQWHLVDTSLAQASSPEHGLHIERGILDIPLPHKLKAHSQIDAVLTLDDGKELKVTWRVHPTRSFEETPAWEPSHLWLLIDRIVAEMQFEMALWR